MLSSYNCILPYPWLVDVCGSAVYIDGTVFDEI
jgi:hypothetical protein